MAGAATDQLQHRVLNCLDDPNFATICSFLQNFGETCQIKFVPFNQLQKMLENTNEVETDLTQIHILLLRRIYKSINTEKWEKHLARFCHSYNAQDAWEIERFGYKKSKIQTKLRILKNLMESQFDYNTKFKNEVNKLSADNLRLTPLGRDSEGQLYWYQVDIEANLRIYREDADDDTWELVATSREEMVQLIEQLGNGIVHKNSLDGAENGVGDAEASPNDEIVHETRSPSEAGQSDEDDAMIIDENYSASETFLEADVKKEEADRMNTTELGKAVRRMLDTSTSVEKGSIPEIKLDPELPPPELERVSELVAEDISQLPTEAPLKDEKELDEDVEGDDRPPQLEPMVSVLGVNEPITKSDVKPSENLSLMEAEPINAVSEQQTEDPADSATAQSRSEVFPEVPPISDPIIEPMEVDDVPDLASPKQQVRILPEILISEASPQDFTKVEDNVKAVETPDNLPQAVESPVQPVEAEAVEATENHPVEEAYEAVLQSEAEIQDTATDDSSANTPLPIPVVPELTVESSEVSYRSIPQLTVAGEPQCSEEKTVDEQATDKSSTLSVEPNLAACEELDDSCMVSAWKDTIEATTEKHVIADQNEVNNEVATVKEENSEPVVREEAMQAATDEIHPSPEQIHQPAVEREILEAIASDKETPEAFDDISLVTAREEIPGEVNHNLATSVDVIEGPVGSFSTDPSNEVSCPTPTEENFEASVTMQSAEGASEAACQVNTEGVLEDFSDPVVLEHASQINSVPETSKISVIYEAQVPELNSEGAASMKESFLAEETVTANELPSEVLETAAVPLEPQVAGTMIPLQAECVGELSKPQLPFEAVSEELNRNDTPRPDPKAVESESSEPLLPVVEEVCHKATAWLTYEVPPNSENDSVPIPAVEEPIQKTTAWVVGDKSVDLASSQISDTVTKPVAEPVSESALGGIPSSDINLKENENHVEPLENHVLPLENHVELLENYVEPPKTSLEATKEKEPPPTPAVKTSFGLGLVGYDDSSSDDEEHADEISQPLNKHENPSEVLSASSEPLVNSEVEGAGKRKLENESASPERPTKLPNLCNEVSSAAAPISNPIVGEAIEEEMMLIVGEGSGAELEGGNPAARNSGGDESEIQQTSAVKKGPGRPRGRKPTTPRKPRGGGSGRKRKSSQERDRSSSAESSTFPGRPVSVTKQVNGRLSAETPTRQSSRIAKIQEKEEEERRRLEEQRLAQLKEAQVRKQQRQQERELKQAKEGSEKDTPLQKVKKGKGRPPNSESKKYLPTPSGTDSEDEEVRSPIAKPKKRGRKRKHEELPKILMKKGLNPWVHTSSEDDEAVEEEEEEYHDLHEEEEDLVLRSDHEFSPESDLEDGESASPSRHARTVKRGESEDKYDETNCNKCGKGDHPEWILLCDSCDKGWHASCLRPIVWVIPEGQWLCPPCQHKKLVEKLNENLVEYDKIVKKHELEVLRKERLAYVGISLDNVLPQNEEKAAKKSNKERKRNRRQISSDDEEDELMMGRGRDDFIDEREDSSNISQYNSEDSEDEPMYKLRARKATKSFNFKEYDELIDSALRDDDVYEADAEPVTTQSGNHQNGETKEDVEVLPKPVVSKGKVMPNTSDVEDSEEEKENADKESDEEAGEAKIDEENLKRQKELESMSHRKIRRRLNDLDATSEEDSGSDFKGSEVDEDEEDEPYGVEDESEWSGDREADESDDSIAQRGRGGKKGKYGRQEKHLDVGSVRRSTRRARSRIVYDESDQESDEDEPAGGWGSEEESEASSVSSEDATWGKRKKKKAAYNPPKSKLRKPMLAFGSAFSKSKSKTSPKKKKKKTDDDEVDRAWSKHGGKVKKGGDDEPSNKRSTRGKKIDFKVILDLESGESDDDGNVHPKRKKPRLSDYENESDGPSSSKKLVAELNAAQAKAASSAVKTTAGANESLNNRSRSSSSNSSDSDSDLESKLQKQLLKPVPAPPFPPVARSVPLPEPVAIESNITSKAEETSQPSPVPIVSAPPTQPTPLVIPVPVTQPSTNLMMSEILASSGNKKQANAPSPLPKHPTPPPSSPGLLPGVVTSGMVLGTKTVPPPTTVTAGSPVIFSGNINTPVRRLSSPPHQAHGLIPSEISRVPNPAYFPPNQHMRFPWDRNTGPPPPPYQGRGPPPQPIGKPPPLNSSQYPSLPSRGPPPRTGYVPPPPLRIPNPSGGPPMQSFQQFKRDPVGSHQMMYRMPPQGNGGRGGGPPPNILAHLQSSHERFFGPHGSFGGPPPYGMPQQAPMYPTTQPQQFDYRPEDSGFKEELHHERRPSPTQQPTEKAENKNDGEFGGLVSYFSSQRGEEDMDT